MRDDGILRERERKGERTPEILANHYRPVVLSEKLKDIWGGEEEEEEVGGARGRTPHEAVEVWKL